MLEKNEEIIFAAIETDFVHCALRDVVFTTKNWPTNEKIFYALRNLEKSKLIGEAVSLNIVFLLLIDIFGGITTLVLSFRFKEISELINDNNWSRMNIMNSYIIYIGISFKFFFLYFSLSQKMYSCDFCLIMRNTLCCVL